MRAHPLDDVVEDYLRHLKVERNLSRHSLDAYGNDLRQLLDFLAEHEVTTTTGVTPPLLLDFLVALTKRGLSSRSQARRWVAVRGLFRWL
ncbi:MAG: site-specific integrase, partial [Deltaproteobacteria bacterium]|nr:site-specific integrase [Deltaproteobacteria bacterium]